jgi:serine/threonine protein kinase
MDVHTDVHPTDQTLSSYGLGELDDGSAEAVNKHLEQCSVCRQRVAQMSADSFLGRLRDDWGGPGSHAPIAASLAGLSMLAAGSPSLALPATGTLPPGLANHLDYEIKRELGRGGMGVVYLAYNRLMGRDEVLKVMGRQIMERPGVLDRFLREIRAVAKLRHPNIVTAYHATRVGEGIVFAMEYVEGLDLTRMVKAKGPLPVGHSCNFVYQAALGLQHAHEEGLVHRDIKPGNLMLSRKGHKATVKILDFGLAKVTREQKVDGALTSEGQALGTPDFIAPEQILDAMSADIRADIYSLGCTLYYLLSGGPPFQANSLYDMFQAHISRDAALLNFVRREVPSELAALVAKMIAKDPTRRFQTPGDVAQSLTPFFTKGNAAFKSPKTDLSQADQSVVERPASGTISTPTQPATDSEGPAVRAKKAAEPTVPEALWESLIEFRDEKSSIDAAPAIEPTRRPPWVWPSVAAGVLLIGFVAAGLGGILRFKTPEGKLVVENAPENAHILIDGETKKVTMKQAVVRNFIPLVNGNDTGGTGSGGSETRGSGTGGGNVDPSRYCDVQLIASCSGERGESFNGGWFSVAGPNSTIKPPLPPGPFAMSSGGYLGTAAHVTGSRALGGWAKLGINMLPGTGLLDASGYHGISFYAKADKPMEIQVMLAQENNDPSYGLCAALKTCYNYPRRTVAVGTIWSRFVVPFDALLSAPLAGGGRVPVTPATIKHFEFVMPVGAFDFWVDEIYFVRRQ